jgi:hypothetical protein
MPPPLPRGERALDASGFFDRTMPRASRTHNERMLYSAMNGGWHRVGLPLALCCPLFVASLRCEAQNLVPNASFEETDTCPYSIGFQDGDRPLNWSSYLESPDYFNACAGSLQDIDTLVGVPLNGWGYQAAMDGDAYVGFFAGSTTDEFREYVGAQLLEPLVIGQTYHVSFWVNLAWDGSYWYTGGACNNVGMLFATHSNTWVEPNHPAFPFRNYAQVYSATVIADTADWTLVSGSFTADSAYQFVVLGNFFDNAHTLVVPIPPGAGEVVYYFVDDICVSPDPLGCVSTGIEEIQSPSLATAIIDPASDELVLNWPGQPQFETDVLNLQGQVVKHGRTARLSIEGLSAGLYVACIKEAGKSAFVKFVISQ